MPISPEFYNATLEKLSQARPIRAKKMFGGAGVYHNEVFFSVLDDDKIFFKVNDDTVKAYEDLGMTPWLMDGVPQNKYRELPGSILNDPGQLGEWIDASVEAAKSNKKPKK